MRTIRAVIAALSLLLSTSVPVSPAELRVGSELWYFNENYGWGVWGDWGIQYPSTYDGDGTIAASVDDRRTDGSCVAAIYKDGGRTYFQAVSCWQPRDHFFFDQTGDSDAFVRVDRTRYWDPERWKRIRGY